MKSSTKIVTILVLILSLAVSAFATNPKSDQSSSVNWKKAEQNYVRALSSENIGVRESAAGYLAEYRLSGAVKDLINVLRNDKVEQIRMASAAALARIGDPEGRAAIAEAAVYDGSEKVAKFCEQLLSEQQKDLSSR